MTKYIIKFTKTDAVKYVSHLDIVRVFGRCLRRAGVNVSFSGGFNPHPVMSFAHPLGVGIASECELMELSLEDSLEPQTLTALLNRFFPGGFSVLGAKTTEEKSPFRAIALAQYRIALCGDFPSDIGALMDNAPLILPKRSKSGVKDTDIAPFIRQLTVLRQTKTEAELEAVLSCGNENLKPELLLSAIEKFTGATIADSSVLRTRLMDATQSDLVTF